ncbi:MAG: hypothetical protein ACK4IB_02435 [Erythrobacter sp.]
MQRPARVFLIPALVSLAAGMALPALAKDESAGLSKGETELAKLLEGRVAGDPVRCIRNLPNEQMRTIDGTAYVFGRGDVIYLQRTRSPEAISGRNAVLANRFSGSQLCRMDVVTTFDRLTGFFTGGVAMEDFVPYTRITKTASSEGALP